MIDPRILMTVFLVSGILACTVCVAGASTVDCDRCQRVLKTAFVICVALMILAPCIHLIQFIWS